MADEKLSTAKNLRTAQAARELGLQPHQFLALAAQAGLKPHKKGKHHLWSDADVQVVRGLVEDRG